MYEVTLEQSTISLDDINRCVSKLEEILQSGEDRPELVIRATVEVREFDPLLMAYLMAYQSRIGNLKILLSLPLNATRTTGRNSDVAYQLFQYRTFAYVSTSRTIYDLEFQDRTARQDQGWTRFESYAKGTFVSSSKFFPILLIDGQQERFDRLFRHSLDFQLGSKERSFDALALAGRWHEDMDRFRKNAFDHLKAISSPLDPYDSLLNLAQMYLIDCIYQSGALTAYFNPMADQQLEIGGLDALTSGEYLEQLRAVFAELENSTLLHIFMFATLLSDQQIKTIDNGRMAPKKNTYKRWSAKFAELWGFTKDLVAGIIELAKNIQEHCTPDTGAISVRVLSIENWTKMKTGSEVGKAFYEDFAQRLGAEEFAQKWPLVDVNVIDIGKVGIIRKLIENTSALTEGLADGDLKQRLLEDLSDLENGKVTFANFLDTSRAQLNQQSKRSIAHFGLLTLSRLVTLNNGLIAGSTIDAHNASERDHMCFPELSIAYTPTVGVGTNYQIVLPIRKQGKRNSHLPHNIAIPAETTAQEISGIEQLFDYEFLPVGRFGEQPGFLPNPKKKYLLSFSFGEFKVDAREDVEKIYAMLAADIAAMGEQMPSRYAMCLDLDSLDIDESHLFRLLGRIELEHSNIPIILYNLSSALFHALTKVNDDFHAINPSLDYWNSRIATLVYSFEEVDRQRFHFADVLFGATIDDFLYINWQTSFASFNSTAITERVEMEKKFVHGEPLSVTAPKKGLLFYTRNAVLPFELLLQDRDGKTLFDQNTMVLLQNELIEGGSR